MNLFRIDFVRTRAEVWIALTFFALFACSVIPTAAQTGDRSKETKSTAAAAAQTPVSPVVAQPSVSTPFVHDLSGITLGMTDDEAKAKLGKPDASDASGLYFTLGKGQSVQVRLDSNKKITAVAVIYSGNEAQAPEFSDVFGPDASPQSKDNGSVYKMVRYPTAGYWVAYSRLNLENGPMTTITLQKLRSSQP